MSHPDQNINIQAVVYTPVMSKEKFSEIAGFSQRTVEGWISRGYIPTVKIGKHRVINLHVLSQEVS